MKMGLLIHSFIDLLDFMGGIDLLEEALHGIMIKFHLQVSSFNYSIVFRASSSRSSDRCLRYIYYGKNSLLLVTKLIKLYLSSVRQIILRNYNLKHRIKHENFICSKSHQRKRSYLYKLVNHKSCKCFEVHGIICGLPYTINAHGFNLCSLCRGVVRTVRWENLSIDTALT